MKLFFSGRTLIVRREPGERRCNSDSDFWRRLERTINRIIRAPHRRHKNQAVKREMVRDRAFRHMVCRGEYYIRTVGMALPNSRPRDFFLRAHDGLIEGAHIAFNAGEKPLEVIFYSDFPGDKP